MILNDIKPGQFFTVPGAYGKTVFLRLEDSDWSVFKKYALAVTFKVDTSSLAKKNLVLFPWDSPQHVPVELVAMEDV